MIATLTAFDKNGTRSHHDTRYYPDLSLLWEHIGCQQNNRRTVRVQVETDSGLNYRVRFPRWNNSRRYVPSYRFQALLRLWSNEG